MTMDSLNSHCRICLEEGEIPIFGEDEDSGISLDINSFGDIQLSEDDDFPKHICDACFQLLLGAIVFRNTAKDSDKLLKDSLFGDHFNYSNSPSNVTELSEIKTETDSIISGTVDSNCLSTIEESEVNDNETIIVIVDNQSDPEEASVSGQETVYSCDLKEDIDFESMKDYQEQSNDHILTENQLSEIKEKPSEDKHAVDNQSQNTDETESLSITECNACKLSFDTMEDYEEHCNSELHINTSIKTNAYQHKVRCTVCEKFVTKNYLKSHLLLHGDKKEKEKLLHQCPYCGKTVVYTYLNGHIQRKHKDKVSHDKLAKSSIKSDFSQFICDKCGKTFNTKNNLKQHILIHGGELKYKCIFCPYRGLHAGLLKIHVRTHTKDYNYKCTECPAKFLTKSNLNKHHRKKHTPGSGEFQCESCEKCFYSKPELNQHHEAVHLGIKKHICNICGKAFSFRNYMMCHQLKAHKRKKLRDGTGRLPNYLLNEMNNGNETND